jgi:raffinose/stachyose/melibiose transport system substrate-binding protein
MSPLPPSSRRTPPHRVKLAVLGVAAAVALAACGSDDPAPPGAGGGDKKKETTLVVQQSAEWGPMMAILVEKFQKDHPGVKVQLETITPEQKSTTNSQVITSANPPDIAQAGGDWRELAKNGDLVSLADMFTKNDIDARLAPGTPELLKVEGVPYAIPIGQAYDDIVFYNKELFAKAGIEVPADRRIATSQDLYDIVKKLKAAGAEGLTVGGTGGYQFGWMVDGLLPTSATEEEFENYNSSWEGKVDMTAKYTDPAFVKVLETIQDWGKNGVFQEGYLASDTATASALYYQGRAGMVLGGSWYVGEFKKNNLDFTSDFLLLPPVEGGKEAKLALLTGAGMVLPSKSDNIELAKEFMALWLSDEMQLKAVANTNFSFPVVTSIDVKSLSIDPLAAALVEEGTTKGTYATWSAIVPGSAGQQVIDPNVASMLAGKLTPQQVAQKQQEAIEKLRKSAK